MIADEELYRLAVFLGSAAMLLIVLYHYLQVNSDEEPADSKMSGSSSLTDAKVGTIIR